VIRGGLASNRNTMAETDDCADRARMQAFRAGNRAAGQELYRRYFGRLRRYFANKACQQADVEDLVGRTFELLFDKATKILDAERFGAYVLGIARNVWLAHIRVRMRMLARSLPAEADDGAFERYLEAHAVSLHSLGAGKTTILERDERLRKLLDALRELPVMYQEVLELHYWEELSFEALAPVLQIPVGTAKSRLRLVKTRLYEYIESVSVYGDERRVDEVLGQVDAWAHLVAAKVRRAIPN
jgi:RNA polymerase sigma-70 factor (ECF subfamily)